LPFVHKNFHVDTKQKAFLFLIRNMGFSFKESQRMISKGRLICNGKVMSSSGGFIEGECSLILFSPFTKGLHPLFVTDKFALFDKPSGLLIHPQNRHTPYSLTDEVKYHFSDEANIVHRIDKETSGLVLASRYKDAEVFLKSSFENRTIQKEYLALVRGKVQSDMKIDEPLYITTKPGAIVKKQVLVDGRGKRSITYITPIKYFPVSDMTLIAAYPKTGRQHQIRVHLFHVKHPIVGDTVYGIDESDSSRFLDGLMSNEERKIITGSDRLMLHANSLRFSYGEKYFIQSKYDFQNECEIVSRETR